MKLNLFNGIIVFEGSVSELKSVMVEMPDMTQKLVDLQLATNESIVIHQTELSRLEAEKQKNSSSRPPGYQQ